MHFFATSELPPFLKLRKKFLQWELLYKLFHNFKMLQGSQKREKVYAETTEVLQYRAVP